jgi:hypothetical protein
MKGVTVKKAKSNQTAVTLVQTIQVEFLVDLDEVKDSPDLRWKLEDQATKLLGDHAVSLVAKVDKRKRFEKWETVHLSSDIGVLRRTELLLETKESLQLRQAQLPSSATTTKQVEGAR